jgi:hypothetical protein
MANFSGGSFRRVILAGHFGTFIWRAFMANEASGFQRKGKAKEMKENVNQ